MDNMETTTGGGETAGEEEEDVSFHLGELFNSYEELECKLEKFSKRSLVHYWRRDSRTVSGAHMKTARHISEKLRYYSVKYACIYGGQKFLPRGAGRRQSQSIRTNCPAHIMLRASKDGNKLEVTSVNNDHNHEISEELFKKLPQERKLCGEMKQEVQELMQLHIDRKRLKEYVRLRTNKILRSKDLFNIAAANKQKKTITPERAYELFERIRDLEDLQNRNSSGKVFSESDDDTSPSAKRIKKEPQSPWGQDELSSELAEASEGNDGEDSYTQLSQEEVVDDMDTTEDQLLSTNTDGDLISANGEIVGELVMQDDPSVIIESIVNTDEYGDERNFGSYRDDDHHLKHQVDDHTDTEVLSIDPIGADAEIDKLSKTPSNSPVPGQTIESLSADIDDHSPELNQNHSHSHHINQDSHRIWIMKESPTHQTDNFVDDDDDDDDGGIKTSAVEAAECRPVTTTINGEENSDVNEVVFAEEASHQLLLEQLAVLRAEKNKLHHETEMLKLKKNKLKLQIDCFTSELSKQEMEKEKLRLEITLLKSKVDGDGVSLLFVP
ncbi:uncharacterized protein LOC123272494 [Cotesia glomerata]|uniref:ZSWIM3 N-terminal domain-containing protein n=1 Tax=Cotesia glomerata TaxID=32391 RepID=A0AAV7J3W7_COTGL|nr:uncharacterized protein LOC123272494 [Cotesia glomerata]KAH0564531.1 hypothetical protein KQX54_012616 [Cotesia glomerata]